MTHSSTVCCTRCRLLQCPVPACVQCGTALEYEAQPEPSRHGWIATGGVGALFGLLAGVELGGALGPYIGAAFGIGALLAKPIQRLGFAARAEWPSSLATLEQHAFVPPDLTAEHDEVVGRATPIDDPIESPISRQPALAYEVRILLGDVLVARITRAVPFWVLGPDGNRVHVSGEMRVLRGNCTSSTMHHAGRAVATPSWLRLPSNAVVAEHRVSPNERLRVRGTIRKHDAAHAYRDGGSAALAGAVGSVVHIDEL